MDKGRELKMGRILQTSFTDEPKIHYVVAIIVLFFPIYNFSAMKMVSSVLHL